jgi:FkbM family methyltransferase
MLWLAGLAEHVPANLKYRLSWLRGAYVCALRAGSPTVTVNVGDCSFRWQIDQLTSQRHLRGTYEPYMQEVVRRFVHSGSLVYDIGAHAGFHSLFAASLGGVVFAFEPNPGNAASLSRQVAMNPSLRITVQELALGDFNGTAHFDTSGSPAESRIAHTGRVRVEVRTIDSLDLPAPSFMKVDVEGMEAAVLKGAWRTIRQSRPVIAIDYADDRTLPDAAALLGTIGYRVLEGPPVLCLP